jgi:hypothetical protein
LKKKLISNNLQTHPNLLALEKNHPHARKVRRAYHHANLEVEGRGEEEKSMTGFLMQMYKRKKV